MHGTQHTKLANDPTITNDRYQAQWKGEGWHVFDSHTNGWGAASYAKAFDAQQAADALNTGG
jgi:hypothetical protein